MFVGKKITRALSPGYTKYEFGEYNMTIEDIKEYKDNAIKTLKRNSQYVTAKATEEAFDLLIWFEEMKREYVKEAYNE